MCRKRALAATVVMLAPALMAGPSAWAWGSKPAPKPAAAAKAESPAPPAPSKATPQEREAAERMEPLARAAFWAAQVNADPRDADAGIRLASALRALGRYQEAYQAAQAVLIEQPDNVEALLETARVAVSDRQGFFAIEPARKAMALAPKDWRAPSLLAVGYDQTGRAAEALEAHRKALALAPDNPTVLSNAAMFHAGQGDRAEAERLLRKAAALPGAGVQVRQNLAIVLGLEGKLDEAERLQRQDLPPEMAANNMAFLRAAYANK